MTNKYLEKLAGPMGTNIVRSVDKLVTRTKQLDKGVTNRTRAVNMGLSNKPIVKPTAKLQALRNQSSNKVWSN